MTLQQALPIALLGELLVLFVWDRFRFDVVALLALLAAVACGIVEPKNAFRGVNIDPFLMAVAVGASCDFLSPIGHQCNTLVMRPGGYRFGDYWHLGLPLSVLVAICGVSLILLAWPLH